LDGKGDLLALFLPFFLVRSRGSDGGIKGDIAGLSLGRARLDVAAAFSFSARPRTPATFFAGKFV
jgi:hypothetical protein